MSNIQTSEALNLLSLAPKNENTTKKEPEESKSDGEEFLNSLLQAIDEKDGSLPKDFKAPQKENTNLEQLEQESKLTISDKMLDEKDALKLFEGANFMQILSLLEVLQSDSKDIKLNKLVKDNITLLNIEKNLNKLKSVKNINELLSIAKELGLNIKNIKFEQIKDLKSSFPNLDKKGFFDIPKQSNTNVFQDLINQKISNVLKEEGENLKSKNSTKTKDNQTSLLSSALKNIELPTKKDKKIEQVNTTIQEQKLDIKDKKIEKIQILETKSKDIQSEKLPLQDVKTNFSQELKLEQNQYFSTSKKDAKKLNDIEIINLTQNNQQKNIKSKEKIEPKTTTYNNDKLNPKEENFTNKINSVLENSKDFKNNTIETKNQNIQNTTNNFQETKVNYDNLFNQDKNIKLEKTTQNTNIFSDIFKNTTKETTHEKENSPQENLNSFVRDLNRVSNDFIKNQNIPTKETFNDFAQEFKEKLESYKAPITRFSITLNPHNLGEVEVTLVQRGSNLNISFNSNQNTLNLFIQHQAEFKNALVNMGFTNLEMNFTNQERKEQNNQQKQKQSNSKEEKVNFEKEIQEKPSLEMVLAKYF
ncbi:flagellar hook-length control protein FliK [Campylobacter peloridis]|uniref:Flagellar hook-length control protein FliK n=1 Tax=Campylobacter peloridis TaxID=488546 RepID=A0A5C7DXC4_9BACT|nr:flagellar hook-length control protein FliK [Campylobacter peloridis]TXE83789.1 flagellar hook-length control protein FliK [Campylobacter peloridis]